MTFNKSKVIYNAGVHLKIYNMTTCDTYFLHYDLDLLPQYVIHKGYLWGCTCQNQLDYYIIKLFYMLTYLVPAHDLFDPYFVFKTFI